jgi:trk system potassium uptake protein TrkA
LHIVIMGCGRVGTALAKHLLRLEHSVAVIDQDPLAFRRLGDDFPGRQITGVGFDRDTLMSAGIKEAEAFAAVSNGDNSNILAARVARETFGVSNVVARIYDPGRAEVYQRLGIPTVATVRWTADQMARRLLPSGAISEFLDPSGAVVLAEVQVHGGWVGSRMTSMEAASGARVAFLTRLGEGLVPNSDTVYQEGDLVHVVMRHDQVGTVEQTLAGPPSKDEQ